MATPEQRHTLLAVGCPWCGAAPGEACQRASRGRSRRDTEGGVRKGRPLPVTVLDGGAHDARWQAAGLGSAPVVTARVRELHPPAARPEPAATARPW